MENRRYKGYKVTKVTRPAGAAPGGNYRLKAATGKYALFGSRRRIRVPMDTGWSWFALQVEPGSEFAVQRRLIAEGYDTFLPLLHIPHMRKRKGLRARPRLPGYVFIGFNDKAVPWSYVLAVKGVSGVLTAASAAPIPFTVLEMHELVLAAQRPRRVHGGAAKVRTKKKKGDNSIQIMSGPYAGSVVRVIDTTDGEALYAFDMRKYRLNAEPAKYSVNGRKVEQ